MSIEGGCYFKVTFDEFFDLLSLKNFAWLSALLQETNPRKYSGVTPDGLSVAYGKRLKKAGSASKAAVRLARDLGLTFAYD